MGIEKRAPDSDGSPPPPASSSGPARAGKSGLHGWAIAALIVSVLFMVGGLALPLLGSSSLGGATTTSVSTTLPGGARGLTGETSAPLPGPTAPAGDQGALASWSPTIFRLGFSFFAAFAIGYALRAFFGFAVAALGFFFLALFGLQYAGLIEVKWGLMEQRYDDLARSAAAEAKSAWAYITTYLPSGGAALAGVFSGWRRKIV